MVFKSYIDLFKKCPSDFASNAGSKHFDQYEYCEIDGIKRLKKTGFVNRYDEIQSYAKACQITNILNRFLNGEVELLHQANGTFGDFRNAPSTYAEYFDRVNDAKKIFDALPDEIKDKFDDDPEKFFLEFGTSSFLEKVGYPKKEEKVEVIENAE